MFNVNKSRLYLWLLSIFFMWIFWIWNVSGISFTERLEEIWVDIATFSNKKSISRYEIARLLNAANCEDCIQAPDRMKQSYGQTFWDTFKSIDGKDFNDINYWAAVRNKKSYYYCVAYVWDNGYMAWYPSTSTKCQWNFCGQDAITVSEAYQTILNIIQDQIRQKYQINWSNVKSWMNWLTRDRRNTILNQTNIDAINKANSKSTYAQTNDEFQAWLKYCMYNLSWCNFQTFGKIWQAYWPVSELNILYKEWMITAEEAENVYTNPSLNWEDAIRIFWAVFDNYSSCSFNVDYDCDWITNGKDNCPYTYNSNQYDLDGDWIWNVCDDDIDWDWKKNPIWIVDDNNRIIISLWDWEDDKPLWDWELWFSLFINVEAITTWSPAIVRFSTLSSEDIDSIEWDFGDGTKPVVSNWSKASHSYKSNWTFIVRAVAKSKKWWQAFAMTRIFIAAPKSEGYSLNLSSSSTLKNWSIEYTLTPIYSWDLDSISWSVNNNQEKSQKANEKFKVKISENWMYIIDAKWYKNWELKAVSMISFIKNSSPSYANMAIKASNLWEETIITTNVIGINRANIENISINWWWEITNSTNLTQKHIYNEAWLKTIQQTVKLKDWTEYYSIATMNVQNPLLAQSYAINISWKRLAYNQNDKLSLWLSIYPNTPVLSLFTSYQAWQKQFLTSPNLWQIVLNYAYATAWDKKLINSVEVNKCVALINQGTVHINSVDLCEIALKNGTLSKYKCDQDSDWIPDICDDDIDWDWIKNLLWIITRENSDCSISSNNINVDIFKQQFWVCSLDDCPFNSNPDQSDLNNNWIWELCEATTMNLLNSSQISNNWIDVALTIDKDQDQDGISDGRDNCPTIPWNSMNGCPEYYNQNCWTYSTCWNWKVEAWETCLNCPQDVWTCCGNGNLESWETCETCPADAWICELCWNGIIDAWENCKSCSKDLKDCTAICWNDVVEDGETCENCSVDVWECTATCWNWKVELAEDCGSCSKDVKQCRNELCWNGKVDANEECDEWENNWKWICTLMCTRYNPNNPKCWNWVVDDGETCENCSIDLWYRCVINWDYGEKCGNWVVDDGETCENCSVDVWECTATCWNWKVELAEDCGSCPKDVKQCKNELCGNWRVDVNEQCDNWANNWKDNQCTLMCTKYNPNNPKCWNWEIESWENCVTCAVDLWYRCVKDWVVDKCWNGIFDEWETCLNCPKDLWPCTAFCWDWIIQDAETCKNCPADVWKCSATCGNWKVELAEDCNNCPQDVKQCKRELCWNWKIEMIEECDNWENNWKWTCTLMCIKSNPNQPQCWNWVVDEWEDCNNCPVDLGYRCVEDGHFDRCGNWELDPWETCLNCPKDLWPCTAFCWDWIIQDAETCLNCPADVWKCSATCGNWKVELAEDCNSCSKDVKQCRSELCWNGIIDENEECDSWINNWKPGNQCTLMCVKANPNNPNYGNWDIDPGENCQNASIDLWDKCIDGWDWGYDDFCWDWVIQKWENCRNCSVDVWECTATCWNWKVELAEDCNSCPKDAKQCRNELCWNWRVDANEECDEWKNNGKWACTVMCVKADPNNPNYWNWDIDPGENCQNASIDLGEICIDGGDNDDCWNLRVDEWENCTNCSKDVKDPCVIDWKDKCWNGKKDQWETCENCPQDIANCKCWNGIQDEWENCTNCSKDMKDPCVDDRKDKCWNWKIDKWETCETCSKDLKELCMDKKPEINIPNQTEDTCWNWIQDPGEDCTNCPKDFWWCVENNNCNTCPCEYVDFSTDLTKWDSVRAKLWDKSKFVFYRYSNSVSVENYLDLR